MTDTIKWDGVSPIDHEPIVRTALLSYITDEEKLKATTTSYGDLGDILKKNHGSQYHGGTYGECIVKGDTKGVVIDITDLQVKYEMTWNKAAKAIHRWVHEEAENSVPAVSGGAVLSEEYAKAVKLDLDIKTNAQVAQMSLYEVCKGLREMNITKLYKELRYNSFEAYCEQEVGIKRHMAYKYVAVANMKNVESIQHFGVTKLSLLADLSEDQRTEIIKNTDVENTTVKKLKEEIKQLKSEQSTLSANYDRMNSDYLEIGDKLADAELKLQKSEEYREELCDENDKMSLRISELLAEVDELKDRPIDVTYSDANDKEIEKMRQAMDKCDSEWREKYHSLQDSNIEQVSNLNKSHADEIIKLKEEYEEKLKNAASSTPKDDTQQKSDTYLKMLDAVMDDVEDFLFNINNSAVQTKHIERFISKAQDFIENIENYEGE